MREKEKKNGEGGKKKKGGELPKKGVDLGDHALSRV